MTVEERVLRVRGVALHVRDVGVGPPLLLINGLGAHTAMWAPVERQLPGLRLISYDAPGVGDSPAAVPPPSIPMMVDLLPGLLDQLGLDRVDVLGYSLGGTLAQHLAYRHPERVRRLVLAATTPGRGGVLGAWKSLTHAVNPLRYYSSDYYERSIGTLAGGQAQWDEEFRQRHGADRLSKRPRPLTYYTQIAALSAWSSLPWLDRISAPTLVLTGDDDPLVPPANSFLIASRLRRARLFVAPGEGHLMLFDDNSVTHAVIREFLSAESTAQSRSWREAMLVDRAAADAAIRARGREPLPWRFVNPVLRRRLSSPAQR